MINSLFRLIGKVADRLGLECYVVGGYVRDKLLGIKNDDVDIVVVGSGIKMASEFAKESGASSVDYFQNFGTAKVNFKGIEVEFVGARKESYNRGSRKPIVEDGTLQDDQLRRDFTVNAMAICLNSTRYGELIDPFNGQGDLKKKRIVTPVDPLITFSDDPLRMLRCIRFAVKLGFNIDPVTFQAIKNNVDRIEIVSGERITTELNKILLSPDPKRGISLLKDSGLLKKILPEVDILDDSGGEGSYHHKNNFLHTIQVLENVSNRSDGLWIRWAALLHDIGKEPTKHYDREKGWTFYDHEHVGAVMVEKVFKRLKLPLDDKMKYVQKLVRMHMRPNMISTHEITDSAVRRLLSDAGDDIDDLLILCESDLTTKNLDKKNRILGHFQRLKEMIADLKERDYKRLFQPCIGGNEIMELFNLRPCKEVGILKQALKDAVLDEIVPNTESALKELLILKGKELGLKVE